MNKARRIAVAGLGAMTPALIATDHVQARSVAGTAIAPDQSGGPQTSQAARTELSGAVSMA